MLVKITRDCLLDGKPYDIGMEVKVSEELFNPDCMEKIEKPEPSESPKKAKDSK